MRTTLLRLLLAFAHLKKPQRTTATILEKISLETLQTKHLQYLLDEILIVARIKRCFVIITDEWYEALYDKSFFNYSHQPLAWFYISVNTSEDLLSPNYQTVRILKEIKKHNCDLHFITLLDGLQVKRLMLFVEKNRILDMKRFDFPVAVYEHVPMVILSQQLKNVYTGLEVEIVRALGKALNFVPNFYETPEIRQNHEGTRQQNGSYNGLIGEVEKGAAVLALGDLHLFTTYTSAVDFSLPHSYECLTFLTPESSRDNSWKTFILPFSGGMWAGVLVSLVLVGTIFYILSYFHAILTRNKLGQVPVKTFFTFCRKRQKSHASYSRLTTFQDVGFRAYLNRLVFPNKNEDLFDNFPNCILLTYSMLMYVSLPAMPKNWPLRMLTGWYWIYCILLTVAYRASFTAILANPAPRIAIDTLDELSQTQLTLMLASSEDKHLFETAFDEHLRKLSMESQVLIDDTDVTQRISEGSHAYYDNEHYLRHLRWKSSENISSSEVLHVMKDCIVRMPVGIAMPRNSPFKASIDQYIGRLLEAGLINKWLKDAIQYLPNEEESPQEALIDLRKFWSVFVPLAVGYFISLMTVAAENWHFRRVVCTHPLYDVYNTKLYYNFMRRYDV